MAEEGAKTVYTKTETAALIAAHAALDTGLHGVGAAKVAALTDEEDWCYKLLCAITDPALVNYVYALASYTCTEKSYFIGCDDADIGAFSKRYMNLPTLGHIPFGMLPQLLTLDKDDVISFAGNTDWGGTYVKASDVASITNAKATWYKRLKYLQETIPTRYKVNHTAASEGIKTAITITNKAILGKISLRTAGMILVYLYNGSNYFVVSTPYGGTCSSDSGTIDYTYVTVTPFLPLLPPAGCSFYLGSYSGAYFSEGLCNCYFEVYDDLPSPPW